MKRMVLITLALIIGYPFVMPFAHAGAAETNSTLPTVLQTGLALWVKNGADFALETWPKGGILEGDRKVNVLKNYFRRMDRTLGNYQSSELLESKSIGQTSRVLYLAMNFQRGAVYARFHLYRTEKGWVVQNMDFSTRPEAIMPWLAFEGGKYDE